jgi:hypothetical protein
MREALGARSSCSMSRCGRPSRLRPFLRYIRNSDTRKYTIQWVRSCASINFGGLYTFYLHRKMQVIGLVMMPEFGSKLKMCRTLLYEGSNHVDVSTVSKLE